MAGTAKSRKRKRKATTKAGKAPSSTTRKRKRATPALAKAPRKRKPESKQRAGSSSTPRTRKPTPRKAPAPKTATPTKAKPSARELARREAERQAKARAKAAKARRDKARDERYAAEAEHQRRLARRRELYKAAKERGAPSEYDVAATWLEHIRNDIASVFEVTLDLTEAGGGHAELGGRQAALAARTPWLIVGRFEPQEEINYSHIAAGLQVVYHDLPLLAAVGEQRLSQIRIVFHDAKSNRNEADSVVSKIGGFEYVLSEMVRELVGGTNVDVDTPDAESLAARYAATTVPKFYIFFSSRMTNYRDVSPNAKTQTIKLR